MNKKDIEKICKISGKKFIINKSEQEILEKIVPKFNGKTFPFPLSEVIPEIRIQNLTAHRNEQFMHHNTSCFSGEKLISIYPPKFSGKICSRKEWFSDMWDGLEFGRDFNFSNSFFQNYFELQKEIPRAATVTLANENSEFSTGTGYCKNCYLINSSEYAEDSMYSKLIQKGNDIVDSSYVYDSQLLYECFNVENCYDSKYLQNSKNCSESWFLKNCIGCKNCFGSINLRNKEYYFLNKKLSKDEYFSKIKNLHLEKHSRIKNIRTNFSRFFKDFPHKFAEILNSENCVGDYISNSKNCKNCYDIDKCEDSQNVYVGEGNVNTLDSANIYVKAEICYQTLGTINVYNCNFCLYVFNSSNLLYCEQCFSCKDCFGCIGLRNKQYCIFNKQYTQEEYEKTVSQIIEHMQRTEEWGQFFPRELSPFGYNISLASEYFPLSQESAIQQGFSWCNKDANSRFSGEQHKIPETIAEVNENILQKTLVCEKSKKPYKIVGPELKFYKKLNLPLPHLCPDERHKQRMKMRNPRMRFI